ncbi:FxsA family protein [Actinomadura sp. NEAU-AAG7]|uniref:FxsA family protein n=1 Tax=Actinomadura sp. NEAU-AAG7 TaxID=2839640 RepID=UPI001BE46EA3|nr:FxsA family protein [Actinomadura sp. NEAU-AAG7]MBT2211898.1 FxsA family protein [Actinomadura sp. NEAU-AAG7]
MLLVLVLAFLLLPVVEIYVIIQVGQEIGAWPTIALLVAETLLGGWIVRREGRRAWRVLQETFGRGVMPDRELADAALVMIGGVLLLTPGFVTDVLGLAFVLPFTRPLVRRGLVRFAERRVRRMEARAAAYPPGIGGIGGLGDLRGGPFGPSRDGGREAGPEPSGPVVRGEVIHDEPADSAEGGGSPSRT